jgi:hypothetical protein
VKVLAEQTQLTVASRAQRKNPEISQMGFGVAAFLKLSSFIVAIGFAICIGIFVPAGLPTAAAAVFIAIPLALLLFVVSIPIVAAFLVASRTAPNGLPRLYLFLERLTWWRGFAASLAIGLAVGVCIGLVTHPGFEFDL